MAMKKRVNILFQSDDNFAFMVGVAMSSLLENASKDVFYDIYYFALNLSEDSRRKFEELRDRHPEVDYRFTIVDAGLFEKEFISMGVHAHRGSYVTYFKLFLDRYFKDTDVDRVIHIGADTLITGSLEELADFDFKGAPFAMNWTEKGHERYHPWHYRACIAEMNYFNLPEWRRHRCEERIIRHIKEIGEIYGSKDQGILNVEFQDEYAQLPLKYNVYDMAPHMSKKNLLRYHNAPVYIPEEIFNAIDHPEIIHVARTFLYRPCEEGSIDFNKDLWWGYCERSPWAGMKPIPAYPPLGAKEKLFRWLYQHAPLWLCDWLYIYSRRVFGVYLYLTHLPRKRVNIGMYTSLSEKCN